MRRTRCRRHPQPQRTMVSFASTSTRTIFKRATSLRHLVLISIILCAHLGLGVVPVVQGFERSNRDSLISYKRWKDEMQHAFRRRFPLHHQQSSLSSTSTSKRQRRNRTNHPRHHATTSAEEDQDQDTTIFTVGPSKSVFKLLRRRLMRTSATVIEGVRPSMSSSSSLSSSVVVPSRSNRRGAHQLVSLIDRGGSLPPPMHVLDHCGRFVAVGLGSVVVLQTVAAVVKTHGDALFELASRLMSSETVKASQTVRRILASVKDHGVIDVFSKYPTQELLASVYALSRLQAASQAYDRRRYYLDQVEEDDQRYDEDEDDTFNSTTTTTTPSCTDTALLEELAYFLPFASAAYGWTMDLATAGRLHFGDLEALLKKTSIRPEDVVTVNMESQANRPAFFIVRDPRRKKLVVGIRGTWSAKDLLTDLCCTPEEYQVSSSSSSKGGAILRTHMAHRGMLEAARGVDALARDMITKELEADPSLSLVIVGHSLGGSVAAVLGTLWEDSFPDIHVYAYGPACVTPSKEYNHINNGGKTTVTIVSAINEADPFPVLSLGHVADVSHALAHLCDNPELRGTILIRTDGRIKDMDERDLEWCSETMQGLRESMVGEKLYPPGRLLYLSRRRTRNNSNNKGFGIRNPAPPTTNNNEPQCRAIEVPSTFFHDLVIGHRMFDLTRHVPRLYEKQLQDCLPATADNTREAKD